jgi:hypothetical protein
MNNFSTHRCVDCGQFLSGGNICKKCRDLWWRRAHEKNCAALKRRKLEEEER